MKNQNKNILYIVCIFGILLFCGDKIYRIWQYQCAEKVAKSELINKRILMDTFYTEEFQRAYTAYWNSEKKWLQDQQLYNTTKSIEDKMVKDGYNYAEAGEIKNKGIKAAGLCFVY